MARYIMSVVAQDRSGIISELSGALAGLNGNIEAANQKVLVGYFEMMFLFSIDDTVTIQQIEERIQTEVKEPVHIYITNYQEVEIKDARTGTFIITLIGPDKPGILYRLTQYLASKLINIDDLQCNNIDGEFVVICQVSLPLELDLYMIQTDLEEMGKSMNFSTHIQHENIFVATNEIDIL